MRISDCSSDVCSSDLQFQIAVVALQIATAVAISERHLPLQSGFRLRARSALGERYPAWAAARDAAVATGHEQRQKHSHTDGAAAGHRHRILPVSNHCAAFNADRKSVV